METLTDCSTTCGPGVQSRTRDIEQEKVGIRTDCPDLKETIAREVIPCLNGGTCSDGDNRFSC